MGSRENQGLQIALILFVAVTVLLAATTYIYWRKSDELAKEVQQKTAAAHDADATRVAAVAEAAQVKAFLGFAPEASLADIQHAYDVDMSLLAAAELAGPSRKRDYRRLVPFFVDEMVKRSQQVKALIEKLAAATDGIDVARREEQARTLVAVTQAATNKDELGFETGRYRTNVGDIKKVNDETRVVLERTQANAAAESEENAKALAARNAEIARLGQVIEIQRTRLKAVERPPLFETADGKIAVVDQRTRLVTIDLGSADGLPPQIAFSVVDRDASRVGEAKKKGTIEVVRVLDSHLAEARIVEDDLRDPILADDQIFSPIWQRGQKSRFALVGFMDVDGDGVSDRARIRSLIAQSGGEVSVEVADDGKRTGKLDVDTRYIVIGKRPDERTNPAALAAYTALLAEADRLGIEPLSFQRLLGMASIRSTGRTVPLDR